MSKSVAHVLTDAGDVEVKWDPKDADDCKAAESSFRKLLEEGYEAYIVEGSEMLDKVLGSDTNKVGIEDFDRKAGRLLMSKKVVVAPARVQGGYPTEGMNLGRL
jgi:hypothetical protein